MLYIIDLRTYVLFINLSIYIKIESFKINLLINKIEINLTFYIMFRSIVNNTCHKVILLSIITSIFF